MNALEKLQSTLGIDAAPRIQPDVPWETYRAMPGVSITRLKEIIQRSPKHYRYRLANPKDSAELTLGRLVHLAVLEPDRFESSIAVWAARDDEGNLKARRGKEWKEFKAEAEREKRQVITFDELAEVRAICASVRAFPLAAKYLENGAPEVTLSWTDEETGATMKGRVDWLRQTTIVGLKTTSDLRQRVFSSQAARLAYHAQWAAYFDGYVATTGAEPSMVEIVVETPPPHDVAVFTIPQHVIDIGRDLYRAALKSLCACEESDDWPGMYPRECEFDLPRWAYPSDVEFDLGLEGLRDD